MFAINYKMWGFILTSLVVASAGVLLYLFFSNNAEDDLDNNELNEIEEREIAEEEESEPEEEVNPAFDFENISATTGVPLSEVKNNENGHFITVIENSPNARPQTGLVNADIVFEMEVEGTTTRFLALFNNDIPNKVGPVRSARHYFLPIADNWRADFYHYGKSKFADPLLDSMKVSYFDGTRAAYRFYERDLNRKAPHNAYLLTKNAEVNTQDINNTYFGFSSNIEKDSYIGDSKEISIFYNSFTNVKYLFDEEKGNYIRLLNGEGHKDRETGEIIRVNNIIILFARHSDLGTKQGHIDIDFESEGEIVYISNGRFGEGTWLSDDNNELSFYDLQGNPLIVQPGKTWIQVVNKDKIDNVNLE